MKVKQILDGLWDVVGYGSDGQTLNLKATVPGMIHVDLEREGIIPPMFWRDNEKLCQWVENRTWEYSTTFIVEDDKPLKNAFLNFDGLDTYACITLNGHHVASTDNGLMAYSFDVSKYIQKGKNYISVTFTPFWKNTDSNGCAGCFSSDRVPVRRIQCTFYWDWVGRFVSCGPWRSVYIEYADDAVISSVFIDTVDIAKTSASLDFTLETQRIHGFSEKYRADVEICAPKGNVVWRKNFNVYQELISLQIDIADPQLWWPIHYGEQPLYSCNVKIFNQAGELLDQKSQKFGIRTVRIEQLQDQPNSCEDKISREILATCEDRHNVPENLPGSSFTVLVNGVRIMGKGANWVPADPLPSRITKDKYHRLITLAKDGNFNILRVWGGGIYEDETFFDFCDEYGILINHDFMMACCVYPSHKKEWLNSYAKELRWAIKKLRIHPSVAWYAGDNECEGRDKWDEPRYEHHVVLKDIYLPLLKELDARRPFFPSSPYGGHDNECPVIGDAHWAHYPIFTRPKNVKMPRDAYKNFVRFATESMVMGVPLFSSLKKFLSIEDLADDANEMLNYHAKDNPYKPEGNPTLFDSSMILSEEFVMGKSKDVTEKIIKHAYQQYYWVYEVVSTVRRQKWYSSGIQFWMYNDCWPSNCWSLIDFELVPKGGWYAMKHAGAPITVSINKEGDTFEFWVVNDGKDGAKGSLEVSIVGFDNKVTHVKKVDFTSVANENRIVFALSEDKLPIELNDGNQLVARIDGEFGSERTFYFHDWPKSMNIPKAKLKYVVDKEKNTITFSCDSYIHGVCIDIQGYCDDNYFDMLAGETKTVSVECYQGHTIDEVEIFWLNK